MAFVVPTGPGWEARGICYTVNGGAKVGRRWFECKTCNINMLRRNPKKYGGPFDGKIICIVCARRCHDGHDVVQCPCPLLGIVASCSCGTVGIPCRAGKNPTSPLVPTPPPIIPPILQTTISPAIELEQYRKRILEEIYEIDREIVLLEVELEAATFDSNQIQPGDLHLQALKSARDGCVERGRQVERQLNTHFLNSLRAPLGDLSSHTFDVLHVTRPISHPNIIAQSAQHNEIILIDRQSGKWYVAAWHPHATAEDAFEYPPSTLETLWQAMGTTGGIYFRPFEEPYLPNVNHESGYRALYPSSLLIDEHRTAITIIGNGRGYTGQQIAAAFTTSMPENGNYSVQYKNCWYWASGWFGNGGVKYQLEHNTP